MWLQPERGKVALARMIQSPASENELRETLCEIGRRVWQREYVAANDGNFSVRLSPTEILCTPTMVSKGFMKPHELPVITPTGEQLRGPMPVTSEIQMHLEIYRMRPDVNAVVHVHPPHATAFAVARRAVPPCMLPEIEFFLGEIPLAGYETPGTQDFAKTLDPFLPNHNAFLLTNHGAVTCGDNPLQAYYRMESVEHYCRILLLASQAGGWQQIDPAKVRELWSYREKLGMPDRRVGLPDSQVCSSGVPGEQGLPVNSSTEKEDMIREVVKRVLARIST